MSADRDWPLITMGRLRTADEDQLWRAKDGPLDDPDDDEILEVARYMPLPALVERVKAELHSDEDGTTRLAGKLGDAISEESGSCSLEFITPEQLAEGIAAWLVGEAPKTIAERVENINRLGIEAVAKAESAAEKLKGVARSERSA